MVSFKLFWFQFEIDNGARKKKWFHNEYWTGMTLFHLGHQTFPRSVTSLETCSMYSYSRRQSTRLGAC